MTAVQTFSEAPFIPAAALADFSLPELLPRPGAPIHLDLGTGLGHFLEAMARRHPDANWIGLEIDGAILKRAVRRIRRAGCDNVLLLSLEARAFLLESVPPGALAHIWLNFPDPWPKKKHARRRHAHPWMLGLLVSRLQVGGELHLATDVPAYMAEMTAGLKAIEAMLPVSDTPWRRESLGVETKYERKWRQQGRPLHYADWRKTSFDAPTAYPFERQPNPRFRIAALPPRGFYGQGRYGLKVFAPRRSTPHQTGFVLVDRQTGIATPGLMDTATGNIRLNGVWTPWKIALFRALLDGG